MLKNTLAAAVILLLGLAPQLALANDPGLKINSIEGSGTLKDNLDSRLTDDFQVNYQDCRFYLGYQIQTDTDVVSEDVTETTEDLVTAEDTYAYTDTVDPLDSSSAVDTSGDASSFKADEVPTGNPRIMIKWSVNTLSGFSYAVKVGSCADSGSLVDEETDSCQYVIRKTSLSKYSNNELIVELKALLGDTCELGEVGESALYFYFQYADDTYSKMVVEVPFAWDYEPPTTPTELELTEGENSLTASWTDEINNKDEVVYSLYWSKEDFNSIDDEGVSSKTGIQTKSYRITGLALNATYYVAVAAKDEFDNVSDLSDPISAVPVSVADFWETYKESGGNEDGGYCFIATAAFGSYSAPTVRVLRDFRDQVLLSSAAGRVLVDFYYVHGARAAAWMADKPLVKGAVRGLLWPVAGLAWLITHLGLLTVVLLLLAPLAIPELRRRAYARRSAR
jgi:hypothetical protein